MNAQVETKYTTCGGKRIPEGLKFWRTFPLKFFFVENPNVTLVIFRHKEKEGKEFMYAYSVYMQFGDNTDLTLVYTTDFSFNRSHKSVASFISTVQSKVKDDFKHSVMSHELNSFHWQCRDVSKKYFHDPIQEFVFLERVQNIVNEILKKEMSVITIPISLMFQLCLPFPFVNTDYSRKMTAEEMVRLCKFMAYPFNETFDISNVGGNISFNKTLIVHISNRDVSKIFSSTYHRSV